MNESPRQAQIEAAQAYESLMVPALFGEWAARITEAAQLSPGHRVLDVACGTGVLGREAASRVEPHGRVVGIDPHPGMLDIAGRLAPQAEWRRGYAESLPFRDESFDAVVSQFGLMFFDDRPTALREALRVLVPGGRLAIGVWNDLDAMPAYRAEVALLERLGGRAAADALRAPFVLGDPRDLIALCADAGFAGVQVTTGDGTARFPSARVMVESDLRGWLPAMGVELAEDAMARILDEADRVLGPWVGSDGTVTFDTSAHIVTGRRS